jgi:hypothetical protein
VCCINNWRDVFLKLYTNIKTSGLYDKIKGIKCNVLTTNNNDLLFFADLDKLEVIGVNNNLNLYETPTINLLYEHAFREEFYVLYMHTKGVKHNNTSKNVNDWINYLIYFNVSKHDDCIKSLSDYDTVGVNLYIGNMYPTHYSGNFWWSKSEYIRKMGKCVYRNYNSPEFWLTEKGNGKYLSLWNSKINHYLEPYNEYKYADKQITNNVT